MPGPINLARTVAGDVMDPKGETYHCHSPKPVWFVAPF